MTARAASPTAPLRAAAALAALAGASAAAAALGARVTAPVARGAWYAALEKPPYQPPAAAFGPVWSLMYATSAWSAFRVWRRGRGAARRRALALWGGQLALNAAWSPLFFGARRPRAALADVLALLGALGLYVRAAAKVDRAAAWLAAPYLGWVGFASLLNGAIVRRNPPWRPERSRARR